MICAICRTAAKEMNDGRVAEAERLHGNCRGSTFCDCQHRLVSALKQVTEPANEVVE